MYTRNIPNVRLFQISSIMSTNSGHEEVNYMYKIFGQIFFILSQGISKYLQTSVILFIESMSHCNNRFLNIFFKCK